MGDVHKFLKSQSADYTKVCRFFCLFCLLTNFKSCVKMAARRRASRAEFPLYTPPHKKSIDKLHKHWCVKFPDFVHSAYCNSSPHLLYYNCPKGEDMPGQEKILKRFKKTLDKPFLTWYNKDTVREAIQIPYERSEQRSLSAGGSAVNRKDACKTCKVATRYRKSGRGVPLLRYTNSRPKTTHRP